MQKTEIINIKFNSEIDNQSFISKNLYNQANYLIRQEFIKNGKWIRYLELNNILKDKIYEKEEYDNYHKLPTQTSQNILMLLDKNWKSFFKSIKDWKKHPEKYLGMPKLPKYKKKNGRNILIFPFQNLRIKNNYIKIPKTKFEFKIRDKIYDKKINQVRIIPESSSYKIEIIYEIETIEIKNEIKNILSIDLGVNNFATTFNNLGLNPLIINGRNLKSINQFYNKQKSKIQSELKKTNKEDWCKKLGNLTNKKNNKIKDFLHKSSKFLINYCLEKNIDTIIVGKNINWKQNINNGKINNQNFINIPFAKFIDILSYKSFEFGIKFIKVEESYTSKIDHLVKEKMQHQEKYLGKRKFRGLFQSSIGKLINADVNGAIGIMRKEFGDVFLNQPIEGLVFNPVKINIF